MKRRTVISAYTPSNTDREVLKRIFVQRERLLEKVVDRLARSMSTGDKHHILLIGPRGSGKTHLVALAEYELRRRSELSDAMRVAWLGEDDTFTGLIDLALGIADRLAAEYPAEFTADYRTPVRGLNADDAAEAVLRSILGRLGQRSILLIMENLDAAFDGLGEMGQKKWRAFLQEHPRIATLATSQRLFAGVSRRDEAFFGFFDIQHLRPLAVDDARELIRKISLEQGNRELVAYLDSAEGRYRIRALHHLAGGNHRMYVLLAEFLTKQSLDDLVAAFEGLAEDLTPYFQERVRSLPPQQARIVQCLCNADGAMTVKRIAEETFIAEGTCSKQLGHLKQRGYVQSERRGKESFYEMAEPLMRLCLEVKNQRGRPLRLVARFLRAWFPESYLRTGLMPPAGPPSRSDAYRAAALETDTGIAEFLRATLNEEINESLSKQQFDKALELCSELSVIAPISANVLTAEVLARTGDYEACAEALSRIIVSADATPEQTTDALFNRGMISGKLGDVEQALADYTAVIDSSDASTESKAKARINRGVTFGQQGDAKRALADYTAVIDMADARDEDKARALLNRGVTFLHHGDAERELGDYTALIEMPRAPAEHKANALLYRGMAFGRRGDVERALADYRAVIDMADAQAQAKAIALFNRGTICRQNGDMGRALADYAAVISMADAPPEPKAMALVNRGVIFGRQGDIDLALADYTAVIDMVDAPAEQRAKALVNRGVIFRQQGDLEQAFANYTAVIKMADAPAEVTVGALLNRGRMQQQMGQHRPAQQSIESILALPDVPSQFRTPALFSLPETMVPTATRDQVIAALETAFRTGDKAVEAYGGNARDLLAMVLRRGHQEWEDYVAALVPLYVEHETGAKLGQGVTRTIELLATEGYSPAQLDVWNRAWQRAGKDCEDLEIPLRSLDAAVEAIKTGSDRPLFRLPLEIRELIRPLVAESLAG